MTTPANTMADWITTGRAYVRAQLTATGYGLSFQLLSQTLQEFPLMDRLRVRMDALAGVTPPAKLQMLVRVGHTRTPALSPRRDLAVIAGSARTPGSSARGTTSPGSSAYERRRDGSTGILDGEGHDRPMVILAVVLLIFIGLAVLTRVRGGSTRRGSSFLDGGIPGDGAQPSHHHHHHDGGSWGGHHGGFDGGGGGHH